MQGGVNKVRACSVSSWHQMLRLAQLHRKIQQQPSSSHWAWTGSASAYEVLSSCGGTISVQLCFREGARLADVRLHTHTPHLCKWFMSFWNLGSRLNKWNKILHLTVCCVCWCLHKNLRLQKHAAFSVPQYFSISSSIHQSIHPSRHLREEGVDWKI